MQRKRIVAAAICCMVSLLAMLPAAVHAENYRLVIDAPDELIEPIRTRTLLGRWIDEEGFEPEQLPLFVERGREEIEAVARDAGYFAAQVEVTSTGSTAEGSERAGKLAAARDARSPDAADAAPQALPLVSVVVNAGPRTTVATFELVIEGPDEALALRERLLEEWPQGQGAFFRPSQWESGKRLVLELLRQRGFLHAEVAHSEARVDVQKTSAALDLRIASGRRMFYGPLEIRGLQRYDRSIVEALRPWREQSGQYYDFDEVLFFQSRLRGSGYFSGADVLPDLAAIEAEPDRPDVPMIATLREQQRQRLHGGIGYSTDEGARALLGYEHRDVFGRGWQLDSGVLWQSVNRRAYATLRTPQRASGYYDLVGARVDRVEIEDELTDRQTLFVGRGRRGREIDQLVSLQYQIEERRVPLDPLTDRRKAFTLGYAWNLRRVDSRLDPRDGYTVSFQASGASRRVLSDANFIRTWLRGMRFWEMPWENEHGRGLLVGMFELGQVFSGGRSGIPSENLFRTGGAQTVRGYRYQSLGVPEAGAIVGGRVHAIGSIEYQHPIRRDWFGAGFVDVGDAADTWSDYKAVYGVGVGVRWRSPVGPVSLDLAWGQADRRFRVHMTVGYAF